MWQETTVYKPHKDLPNNEAGWGIQETAAPVHRETRMRVDTQISQRLSNGVIGAADATASRW